MISDEEIVVEDGLGLEDCGVGCIEDVEVVSECRV